MQAHDAPPAYVEDATFIEAVGWRIPAAVTRPAARSTGRRPASVAGLIVLVPGSLYSDVDGDFPMFDAHPHAYRDLARQLAELGYAVIRYAKRGPGTGAEVVDSDRREESRQFQARVAVVGEALAVLRSRVGADGKGAPIVLAGHSEGGVVVSMAADQGVPADGIVILSGPSVGIFDIMREQLPLSPGAPPEAYAPYDRAVAAIRAGDPLPQIDPGDPTLQSIAFVARSGEAGIRYMAQIDAVDPAATLARVRQPVLLIQGGRDGSVPTHHAHALRAAREAAGLPTELAYFPELTHFYKVAADGMDPMAAFMLDSESDPAVSRTIDSWIRQTFP